MVSRLLTSLDAQIAAAGGAIQVACLRAQKAIYLARQGHADEATAMVHDIRQSFAKSPNAEVTAWVSLAESLNCFYFTPGPQAMDRLRRAQALAIALQHPVLVPLCAAWLAHMEFNANHVESMVEHAARALRLAEPGHHTAFARVSLVIADALHFAGRFDLSRAWYATVREHALAEGDDAMIGAMLHNVATLRANQIRLADSFGHLSIDEIKRAILEMESTETYDIGIGTLCLPTLLPLVRAQIKTATGEFSDALVLYRESLDGEHVDALPRRASCFYADRAWCSFRLGNFQDARRDVDLAIANASAQCDSDDLATTHARVAAILEGLSERELAAEHLRLANERLSQHLREQAQWLHQVASVLPSGLVMPSVGRAPGRPA